MTDSSTEILEEAPENSEAPETDDDRVDDLGDSTPPDAAIARLAQDLERVEREAAEAKDLARRARADLANVRRRADDERAGLRSRALEEVCRGLLPAFDDLTRAVAEAERSAPPADDPEHPSHRALVGLREGLRLVLRRFESTLARQGLVEIEAAGALFDPRLHEAVHRAPAAAEQSDGEVVAVFHRGFLLDGRVVRPAAVVVADGSSAPEAEPPAGEEAGEHGSPENADPV